MCGQKPQARYLHVRICLQHYYINMFFSCHGLFFYKREFSLLLCLLLSQIINIYRGFSSDHRCQTINRISRKGKLMKFSFVDQISVHKPVACGPDLATAIFCLAQTMLLKDTDYFPIFKNWTMTRTIGFFSGRIRFGSIGLAFSCLGLNYGCHHH